jgi:hypothetical protein
VELGELRFVCCWRFFFFQNKKKVFSKTQFPTPLVVSLRQSFYDLKSSQLLSIMIIIIIIAEKPSTRWNWLPPPIRAGTSETRFFFFVAEMFSRLLTRLLGMVDSASSAPSARLRST